MSNDNYIVTEWEKYENINGLPSNVSVEICKKPKGERVPFDENNLVNCYLLDEGFIEGNPIKEGDRIRKWVENEIYSILDKEWNTFDVFNILAWKVGKISYKKSSKDKKENGIKYVTNWIKKESIQIPNQEVIEWGRFEDVANKIIEIRNGYRKEYDATKTWIELLNLANGEGKYGKDQKDVLKGVGTVYLLTILHFITGGEYPIYDKFAMAALVSRELEKRIIVPRDSFISGCGLPTKNTTDAKKLLNVNSQYMIYKELLDKFYGDKWKLIDENRTIKEGIDFEEARNIDRALWVYGHFFDVRQ